MPNDMRRPPWKVLASSRLDSFKGYLARQDLPPIPGIGRVRDGGSDRASTPQTWKQWAGQRLRRNQAYDAGGAGVEKVYLFPGWAARRYRRPAGGAAAEEFEVDVYVSGFAASHRPPEFASRSQRAFLRLAKGFASLPKLAAEVASSAVSTAADPFGSIPQLSPSTEDLLASKHLPPRPTEITEDYEVEALEQQFRRANASDNEDLDSPSSSSSSSVDLDFEAPTPSSSRLATIPAATPTTLPEDLVRKLHANLESRLRPFWSTTLSARTVRINVFASSHRNPRQREDRTSEDYGPIATADVVTAVDGSFQARFKIRWEDMCQHPEALHIAFGDTIQEHDLLVLAEMLPTYSPQSSASSSNSSSGYSSPVDGPRGDSFYGGPPRERPQLSLSPTAVSSILVTLTHSPIRVISDIDDTVKLSNILSGARAVFYNVFVKELAESIIPGMGDWYTSMWRRGVRFHYVSNGPFELLPVVNEFFQISNLPPGSIKLKSYAGRSLFNGLLSAPATRKRAGIQDILDSFPDSKFLLIGDSGEQDLELYAEFAKERPEQILGVFVRDVGDTLDPVDDPTGWMAVGAAGTGAGAGTGMGAPTPPFARRPQRSFSDLLKTPRGLTAGRRTPPALSIARDAPASASPAGYFDGALSGSPLPSPSPLSAEPGSAPASLAAFDAALATPRPPPKAGSTDSAASGASGALARLSEAEKKRYELQMRIYRARTQMPGRVPLRVFRAPGECVEVDEILRENGVGT